MDSTLPLKCLLLVVVVCCWARQVTADPANGTQCIASPAGKVEFSAEILGVPGLQGPKGEKGEEGGIGLPGPSGESGPQGEKGDHGGVGPTGPQGGEGVRGQKGQKGNTGRQGQPGPPGVQGGLGPQGERGLPGQEGPTGPHGPPGPTGPRGRQGVMGPPGGRGVQGPPGVQGPTGKQGEPGDTELTADEFSRVTETLQKNATFLPLVQLKCILGLFPVTAAPSCKEIFDCNPESPSGYYWKNTAPPTLMHCDMPSTRCGSVTGGWRRVAWIDMTHPSGNCPSNLRTLTSPKRMCARAVSAGCTSVRYSTLGINYTAVCGRAIGYQFFSPDGIDAVKTTKTINHPYVDGLSITYDSPRRHLWTYAAGHTRRCLCQPNNHASQPPSFVGQHYYCDGRAYANRWYTDDPLWDKNGCPTGDTCCDPPNLPWFHRTLDTPTSADIEVRWCQDEAKENIGVELLELYIS